MRKYNLLLKLFFPISFTTKNDRCRLLLATPIIIYQHYVRGNHFTREVFLKPGSMFMNRKHNNKGVLILKEIHVKTPPFDYSIIPILKPILSRFLLLCHIVNTIYK